MEGRVTGHFKWCWISSITRDRAVDRLRLEIGGKQAAELQQLGDSSQFAAFRRLGIAAIRGLPKFDDLQ